MNATNRLRTISLTQSRERRAICEVGFEDSHGRLLHIEVRPHRCAAAKIKTPARPRLEAARRSSASLR
jgi:hypothetical protein